MMVMRGELRFVMLHFLFMVIKRKMTLRRKVGLELEFHLVTYREEK